jgi:hypothetical protein
VEIIDGIALDKGAGIVEITEKMIALGIDVGRDVVRDLAGGVTYADSLVVRCRADPDWATVGVWHLRAPEPHVVAAARVVADWLLEGKVFLAAEQVEPADGCFVVGPREDGIGGNVEVASQAERRGWIPAGRPHRFLQLRLCGNECHIERIARMAVARSREPGAVVEGGMAMFIELPGQGHQQVRDEHVQQQQYQRAIRPAFGSVRGSMARTSWNYGLILSHHRVRRAR